ncbi:MAG TPA: tetratricopeptide repeat protein [Pyrinomonadaceae bacterium]|nr:tetratricopeptide repeat protein [Pyrinomonadaceae bacterium]
MDNYLNRLNNRFLAGTLALGLIILFANVALAQEEPVNPTQQAIALFEQGQDAHAKGDFQKAVDLYDKALGLLPEFPEAEFQKGNAYLSLNKRSDAEAAFRRAMALREEWTLPIIALGTLLERRGEFVEAEKLLNKAIELDESSFPAYSALTELKLRTKAPPDVLDKLLVKIRVISAKANPGAAVFATQASLENALGDRGAAKKSIERALAIDPNCKPALYQKADIALAEHDLVLADNITKTIEDLDKGSEDVLAMRARVLLANGKSQDARTVLSTIASPSTTIKALIENIALTTEQSPEALEKILENDVKNPVVLGRLCSLYRLKDANKALDYCHRALEAEPSNIEPAIGYGAALVQAKRYEDAVTTLTRLKSVAPDNATIHANLATALFQLKRYPEAKIEYQWITSRNPVPPIAYYFLAICHDQLREYMDAGANYQLFLKSADAIQNKDEIDKVNLRLPVLEKEIKRQGGRSKNKSGT